MKIGDTILIKSGAFKGFNAEVIEVLGNDHYKAEIAIFGRKTEVEVNTTEVERKDHKGISLKKTDWWNQRLNQNPSVELYSTYLQLEQDLKNASKPQLDKWFDTLKYSIYENETIILEQQTKRRTLERASYQLWWLANNYDLPINPNIETTIKAALEIDDLTKQHTALHDLFLKQGWRSLNYILKNWISIDFELFPLEDAPTDFPWQFKTNNPKIVIDSLFQAIEKEVKPFIHALKSEILCILGLKVNSTYFLLYVGNFYNGSYYNNTISSAFLLGGIPNISLELSDKVKNIGWKTPPSQLAAFYNIHGRFNSLPYISGDYIDTCHGIPPIDKLSEMAFMNKVVKEQNDPVDYDFRNLLEFFSHGDGNGYHFYKIDTDITTSNQIAYWDHETRELSIRASFWDFLNETALSQWFGYDSY